MTTEEAQSANTADVRAEPDPDDASDEAREPTDDELYNRPGVEGGIPYTDDAPGSLGENDWRL